MVTEINHHRVWCKECKEFTIHSSEDGKTTCKTCSTVWSPEVLNNIPKEKLREQHERYKLFRRKRFEKTLSTYTSHLNINNPFLNLFTEPTIGYQIIESDAGLEKIEEHQREVEKAEKQRKKDEVAKHKHLNRNDVCICGSNIKYKKCCLPKVLEYDR